MPVEIATGFKRTFRRPLPALLAVILILTGCSSMPGLEDGQFALIPKANLFKPEGKVTKDDGLNRPGSNKLGSHLKLSDRETDPALTAFFGDGFSGFEMTYEQYRRKNSNGYLRSDMGQLNAGETTESDLDYYGWRLAYMAQVYGYDFPATVPLGTDYELTPHVQGGVGAGVHYLIQNLTVLGDSTMTEKVKSSGAVPFIALRGQLNLDMLKLRLDQSFSYGDWGDHQGLYTDTLLTLRWEAAHDVDVLLGMRRFKSHGEGSTGGNDWELKTTYTGWVVGLHIVF